jgi:hypothetical protein
MNYPQSEILRDVRLTLDQNQVENSIIAGDDDTLELDDVIKRKAIEAATEILRTAPLKMIDCTEKLDTSAGAWDGKAFLVETPNDYLRLAVVEMSDWDMPVHKAENDDSQWRMIVHSRFAGIAPNTHRPLVIEREQDALLEIYGSADSTATVKRARYIAYPVWRDKVLSFPKMLYTALVNMTAALVCIAYKDQQAGAFMQLAQSSMGVNEQQQQANK